MSGVPRNLHAPRGPKTPLKNRYVRRRTPFGVNIPAIALIVAIVPLWLIGRRHPTDILLTTGILGLIATAGLTRSVNKRLKNAPLTTRSFLLFAWIVVTVGFCLSFTHSGATHLQAGSKSAQHAVTELKRTLIAAGIFGLCGIGAKALKKA